MNNSETAHVYTGIERLNEWCVVGARLLTVEARVTDKQEEEDRTIHDGLESQIPVRTHVYLNAASDGDIQKYLQICVYTWLSVYT